MTNLGCNVQTCGYNKDCCCCRSNIVVEGSNACSKDETCCSSFKAQGQHTNSAHTPNGTLNVECGATNCKFNEARRCVADHIEISGASASSSAQTLCSSFVAK